jgi:pimeloyl-ACP methyl ester carboxylesterase
MRAPRRISLAVAAAALLGVAAAARFAMPGDPYPRQGFVAIGDALIEYRDYGGDGPPVVLLAGLGDTALVWDDIGPELAADFRTVAFTRRGYAPSTVSPDDGTVYGVESRSRDTMAAIAALGLARPILVGHSLAGDELSWIGANEPGFAAGLVYLDAALRRGPIEAHPDSACMDEAYALAGDYLDLMPGDLVEVDGEAYFASIGAAARGTRSLKGGPSPMSVIRSQYAETGRGFVVDIPREPPNEALSAGTNEFTPDYGAITVPVIALFAGDETVPFGLPFLATAPPGVQAEWAGCVAGFVAVKRQYGIDEVRAQLPSAVARIVPDTPHDLHRARPDVVVRAVRRMGASVGEPR